MSIKKPVPVDDNGRTLAGWDPINHVPAVPAILNTLLDGEIRYGNKGITLLDANGNPISASTPLVTEANIQNWIRNGNGYQATTGKLASATNANVVMGMGIFNNSTAKNILIYSLRFGLSAASGLNQLNLTVVDPAMGTAPTIVNLKAGGAAGAATVSAPANNSSTSVSVIGTQFDTITENASVVFEVFSNGSGVLLPAAAANGLALYCTMGTAANNYSCTIKWIEY